jgi:Tol biopolymer transport system component/predicted Ser/Thr protein kinase
MIGPSIGHYRIVRKIASGGMGDVFLADDTTLDRQVALKTLPPDLAGDPDRRTRLAREAKAIAALNHPNIVTVYSVERDNDLDFITMEFVQGRTLAAVLSRTGFALEQFFEIAIPLVDAVATAHLHGVMHRDLKPGNVMVSDDGRVKVLDFGLAKAAPASAQLGGSTISASPTLDGHVVGTAAYMSPEQAAGKAVDPRSDIFSLGVVFYEMLTGQRPFGGETTAATIASIIKDTPRPLGELSGRIPRDLARAVHRCLAKNPIDRYQTAIDLRHDLDDAKRELHAVVDDRSLAIRRSSRRPRAVLVILAIAILASIGLFGLASRRGMFQRRSEAGSGISGTSTVQITSSLEIESYPTWSPDGQRLAFQSSAAAFLSNDIFVAQIGSGDPVNLTKESAANDRRPSWSPDGREIAFYSNRDGAWGIWVVGAIGGSARKVHTLATLGNSQNAPQWSKDGRTLFVVAREGERNVVIHLSLASLQTTRVLLPLHDSPQCWDLSVRPDGGRFAYVEAGGGNPEVGRLWTVDASGGNPIPLTDGRSKTWNPTWSPDGKTLFYVTNRSGSLDLWQQAVDDGGQAIGAPLPVTTGMGITSAAFSPDGTKLAFSRAGRLSNVWRSQIFPDRPATWADATRITSERAYIEFVDVSPNGQQLAVSSDRRGNQDLWVMPAAGGEMTRLTDDPTPDWNPRWSPDGKEIAFYAYRSGNRDIWVMPSGGGPARQLTLQTGFDWFPTWSPDGRDIAFQVETTKGTSTWFVPSRGGQPRFFATGNGWAWSPDGKWLSVYREGALFREFVDGAKPQALSIPHRASWSRVSQDGQWIYYSVVQGPPEHHDLWRVSLGTGQISRLTALAGPRGQIGYSFATDDRNVYFTWREDEGDIWVMDVVTPAGR